MTDQNATTTDHPYQYVNVTWPAQVPTLTGEEAVRAAKRLYRHIMARPWPGEVRLTSGNRYTYPRRGVLYVNPEGHHFGGWRDLVHDLSHHCFRRRHPDRRPHHWTHANLERRMIQYVLEQGWLDGALKPKAKAAVDARQRRYQRVLARIKAWETKRKRAENALKKLRQQRRYYERVLAA